MASSMGSPSLMPTPPSAPRNNIRRGNRVDPTLAMVFGESEPVMKHLSGM